MSCRFLGVEFADLSARTIAGGSDEEILAWCVEHGADIDAERIEIWNGFMSKRGWRDEASASVESQKQQAGLGIRDDIQTFFDLMDAEEGRG